MKLRKQIRLPTYNYSSNGYYFITICTRNRANIFGTIVEDQMKLSVLGKIAQELWQQIPRHYDYVGLDEFVIMPNHIHGIVIIDNNRRCGHMTAPTRTNLQPESESLSVIIRNYKGGVTMIARSRNLAHEIWQPRFHDHIIRNDKELNNIRAYIQNNPLQWQLDQEYAGNLEFMFS